MKVISDFAPAKINLYLHVTGKADNGYHLLDSLIAFVDVGDEISTADASALKINITGDFKDLVPAENNTIKKASESLQKKCAITQGASITVTKNLPVGAGIGGGSADAATTLKLLARLWKINISQEEMETLALSIGADVPACLQATPIYIGGIGDKIEKAGKLPKLYVLLVSPNKPLLTKDVFAQYAESFSTALSRQKTFPSPEHLIEFLKSQRNDLQKAAIQLMPEIKTVLETLESEKECLLARMSGSGSTCFGLFSKRKHAEEAALKIGGEHPSWWVRVGNII